MKIPLWVILTLALISGVCTDGIHSAACATEIKPAQNRMFVLPEGMRMAAAVIPPRRARDGSGKFLGARHTAECGQYRQRVSGQWLADCDWATDYCPGKERGRCGV